MQKKLAVAATALFATVFQANAFAEAPQLAARSTVAEAFVESDFQSTWNELINELAGREFGISTLVLDDRKIVVTFQSDVPSRFVDCGEISVQSKHSLFGDRNYNFLAANSVRYMVADEQVNELVDVERRTVLNALASIQLTPTAQGTMVRVEADYAMKIRTREFGNNIQARSADEVLTFDSASIASLDEDIRQGATSKTVTVNCRATGELERRIVSVLGNPS